MLPTVETWLRQNLPWLLAQPIKPPCTDRVTALTGWLWKDERFDGLLDCLHGAIRVIRIHCGKLPVVVLVNRLTPAFEHFAREADIRFRLIPEMQGGGGSVKSVNVLGICNSHTWFETEYQLGFQHHAFPVRDGLEAFVGRYDLVGAPWRFGKDDWITRLLLGRHHDVGNAAFALRSRRLFEMGAYYYRRKYKLIPYCYLLLTSA